MKPLSLILLFSLLCSNCFGQAKAKFSKEEVLADLKYLYESLQEAHYKVYAYTSEQEFYTAYQDVKGSIIKDSLSLLETTNSYQRLIAVIKNGHTEIDFPIQSYIDFAYSGGTVFPLEIAFEFDKAIVRKNWSESPEIKIGSEILSINGQPMEAILSKIYPQISAERPYFKNAKIEMYSFPRYYWQVFGEQEAYEIEIRFNQTIEKHLIKAVNLVEGYEKRREEVLNATMELKFFDKSAYLNPGNFSGDELRYQQFIDSAFFVIKEKNTENLIVDLRNNAGGDNSFSNYLVSYFADQPFKWSSKFSLKTSQLLKNQVRQAYDTTDAYSQKILACKNGTIYDYEFEEYRPQAKKKRFRRKVYVLINRQSHSQATLTAAQIQDYKFGTIVGEETSEYASLYASQFQYVLPRTGIPVKVSKAYIERVNGSKKEEGVLPDIFIKDYLLDEEDEILNQLLKLISKKEH